MRCCVLRKYAAPLVRGWVGTEAGRGKRCGGVPSHVTPLKELRAVNTATLGDMVQKEPSICKSCNAGRGRYTPRAKLLCEGINIEPYGEAASTAASYGYISRLRAHNP